MCVGCGADGGQPELSQGSRAFAEGRSRPSQPVGHILSHDARLAATAAAMADSPKRRFRSKAAGVKAEQPQASGASEVASISGGSALGETVALAPAVPGEFAGDPPAEALLEPPPPPPIPFPPCLWHAWWPLLV